MNDSTSTEALDDLARLISHTPAGAPRAAARKILDHFVVIPRSELPRVDGEGDAYIHVGGINFTRGGTLESRRDYAYKALALVQYLEGQESAETAALKQRRDELAAEITHITSSQYDDLALFARRGIDRIIELEGGAS